MLAKLRVTHHCSDSRDEQTDVKETVNHNNHFFLCEFCEQNGSVGSDHHEAEDGHVDDGEVPFVTKKVHPKYLFSNALAANSSVTANNIEK